MRLLTDGTGFFVELSEGFFGHTDEVDYAFGNAVDAFTQTFSEPVETTVLNFPLDACVYVRCGFVDEFFY